MLADIAANPASGRYISGVPFFPQKAYRCGPAALASVMGYWGSPLTMDDISKEIFDEKRSGTLPIDMLTYAKGAGFDVVYYRGSLDDLRLRVADKTPLILFLNMGYDLYPVGHYITVIGYDDVLRAVIAHSDMDVEAVFTYDELLSAWGKTDFSTFLVRPGQAAE